EPLRLGAPVHSLIGLPHIGAPAAEAERLEAHRLERDIAGEDHQVAPRDLASVLLLDRPKQPACLVEVRVVRPRVEWRESLLAGPPSRATWSVSHVFSIFAFAFSFDPWSTSAVAISFLRVISFPALSGVCGPSRTCHAPGPPRRGFSVESADVLDESYHWIMVIHFPLRTAPPRRPSA